MNLNYAILCILYIKIYHAFKISPYICSINIIKRYGTKSMNLALERPTERLYVLIPTEMERLLNEKAKEMNTKIAHVVRLAIAEFITK